MGYIEVLLKWAGSGGLLLYDSLRPVSSRFRAPNERDPGAGTRLFTPISNGACFFSSHVSREELCPLLHVFISFLFTFSVVIVTLLKVPPAY